MRKEFKLVLNTTILAFALGSIPTYVQWKNGKETEFLVSRPPGHATQVLRQALASATEVRVHVGTSDSYEPMFFPSQAVVASQLNPPRFIFHGAKMKELISAIHAGMPGATEWAPFPETTAVPGSVDSATALEFFAGNRWIADIRIGKTYGLRWYKPPEYIADIRLSPASLPYLEREGIFSLSTDGMGQ